MLEETPQQLIERIGKYQNQIDNPPWIGPMIMVSILVVSATVFLFSGIGVWYASMKAERKNKGNEWKIVAIGCLAISAIMGIGAKLLFHSQPPASLFSHLEVAKQILNLKQSPCA